MTLGVLALMLVVFSFTTGEFVIAGILPEVATGLGVSVPSAGLVVTAYALGMIVGGPAVTVATARLPRHRVMVLLVVVSVLGNLASALAPSYAVLLVARFVSGLVVATFFAVGLTTAVALAGPGEKATAVARVTLGLNLGIVLGAPMGTVVGQALGWRATFVMIAVLAAASLVVVLRTIPSQPPTATGPVLGELRVLRETDVLLAIALTAAGNLGVVAVFTYIAPFLTEVAGLPAAAVPGLLLVYGTGAVIGNAVGGRLADRALLESLIVMLAALAGVLVLLWLLGPVAVAVVVLTFVLGGLAFAIIPGMQTRVMTTATAAPTLALAVNASGFQIAAAGAGWLGGRVVDSAAGPRALPLAAAVATVGGMLLAVHARRRALRAGT